MELSPTHLFNSIRALYCYYWLQDNNLPLDFAKDMLDLACNFEKSRPSKYIGITETAGLVKDWEYLRAVGGQIARIINGDCTYLDEELADVVNTYMVARGTEDKKDEGAGYYGCYESFHNMSFSNCYRKFGGDIMKDTQKAKDWKYYLNETLGKAQMTWADLLKTYLIPILEEAEGTGIMVPPRDFPNATGMVVAHEVTAQEAPQK